METVRLTRNYDNLFNNKRFMTNAHNKFPGTHSIAGYVYRESTLRVL